MGMKKTIATVAISSLLAVGTVAGVAFAQEAGGEGGGAQGDHPGAKRGHRQVPEFVKNLEDFDCNNLDEIKALNDELEANVAENHEIRQDIGTLLGATEDELSKGDEMFQKRQEFKGKLIERLEDHCDSD